ncbi:MAG: hypothetical protein ABIW82_17000 [Dokdonella sp.]
MPHVLSRAITASLAVLAALASPCVAHAQVVLRLTPNGQPTCIATTDYAGIKLAPHGSTLLATGVTMNGCGAGGSSFGTTLTIPGPSSVHVGDTIGIQWTATSAAAVCVYAGSRVGLTGWPAGSTACQGSQCPGAHTSYVTFNTAGSYGFTMVCTNASGFAQATVVAH